MTFNIAIVDSVRLAFVCYIFFIQIQIFGREKIQINNDNQGNYFDLNSIFPLSIQFDAIIQITKFIANNLKDERMR